MKVPRKDEVSGKPIPNLFNQEVMAALRKRGGALWEREADAEAAAEKAGEDGGAPAWADATRIVEEMETTDDNQSLNKSFGLEGSKTKLTLTKTNMDVFTQQLVRVAQNNEKGYTSKDGKEIPPNSIGLKEFIDAAMAGGLGAFSREDLTTMFNTVDADQSGVLDIGEWVNAVRGKVGG